MSDTSANLTVIPPFRRGVNLGNFLETKAEGSGFHRLSIQDEWFPLLKRTGFDFVRIPIRWSAHAGDRAPFPIDEAFFSRVIHLVDTALENGLTVIVNHHHYFGLMKDPPAHRERFSALWRTISRRLKNYPTSLLFELLNEPCRNFTSPLWNDYWPEAYAEVRNEDPARILIVTPADWGNIHGLDLLSFSGMKNDPNLMATFHYYDPHGFTHQGAPWENPPPPTGSRWTGSVAEVSAVRRDLDYARSWSEKEHRRIFLGEFGVYRKYAPEEDLVSWTKCVREESEKRNIPWCIWDFCTDFGVWDPEKKAFREKFLRALIP
jgi:endoglucanase